MEQLGSLWTHCHEIRYFEYFSKISRVLKYSIFWVILRRLNSEHGESLKLNISRAIQVSLKYDKTNVYFT